MDFTPEQVRQILYMTARLKRAEADTVNVARGVALRHGHTNLVRNLTSFAKTLEADADDIWREADRMRNVET